MHLNLNIRRALQIHSFVHSPLVVCAPISFSSWGRLLCRVAPDKEQLLLALNSL